MMKVTFHSYDEIITANQLKIYIALKEYLDKHHYSPTMRELANMVDTKCVGTVQKSLKILRRKGYVDYKDRERRSLKIIKKIKYRR